jgi:hypothetical protein
MNNLLFLDLDMEEVLLVSGGSGLGEALAAAGCIVVGTFASLGGFVLVLGSIATGNLVGVAAGCGVMAGGIDAIEAGIKLVK